jgi:CHASE2 domain-containing sensor protein
MAPWAQNWRKRISDNWRNGVTGAASAVVLGWCFLIVQVGDGRTLGEGLKNRSYDFFIPFRSYTNVSDVAVVLMDETSRAILAQDPNEPWHRALHAGLVEALHRRGAAGIVFDILWDYERIESPAEDTKLAAVLRTNSSLHHIDIRPGQAAQQLASAMRTHGKVVVAAMLESVRKRGIASANLAVPHVPLEPIASAAAGWGMVELEESSDLRIRVPHYEPRCRYTNFAWKAAEVLGRPLPPDPCEPRWISYYGPPGTIPQYSYLQVIETNGLPSDTFSNKVVFVGRGQIADARGSRGDIFDTPVGKMPGVEIQATIFLNLCRGDYLTELSRWAQFFLVLALGVVFGLSYVMVRPWIAAVLAAFSFGLLLAGAGLLVWRFHTWFPWLTVGAIQIPVALAWAVLANTRKVYHEKEVLEQTLATAHLEPAAAAPAAVAPANLSKTLVMPQTPGPKPLPRIMADHELVRFIGGGAYGEVWLARNAIGLYRAFKIIRRDKFRDDAPFLREFRGLEKFMPISMGHPGLVKVLHVGKNDAEGFFFYTMEAGDDQVTGPQIDPDNYAPKNLTTEYRKRGTLPVVEAIDLIVPLCEALDYLHRQSLVHRDIKPSNIIFVNGAPKLADIGLVADISENRDISWVGTDGYIPPEGPGAAGADIYGLGKVLYEITFGQDPRNWPAFPTTLIQGGRQPDLFALNVVLLRACAEQRGRYQSAADMRHDLLRLRAELAGEGETRV